MQPQSFNPEPFLHHLGRRAPDFVRGSAALDPQCLLDELERRWQDATWLETYAKTCPMPGAAPRDYAPRLLKLGEDCSVIAGIHFRGLSQAFPFVDISACSGPLPEPMPVNYIREQFRVFRPKALRLWRSGSEQAPAQAREDMIVLAGPLVSITSAAPFPMAHRIHLSADPELAGYAEYRQLYDAVHAAGTDAAMVSAEDEASLAACAAAGALFRVTVDGEAAGFIAARPDSFRCWRGWLMVDIVLHPKFQGQRLAPALEHSFLERLDPSREPWVFGTIDARNAPSLKTALRLGRRPVETGAFLELAQD